MVAADDQDGQNTVPTNGRYGQITRYQHVIGRYLRQARWIIYDTRTKQYRYDDWGVSIPTWWDQDVGDYNFHLAKCIVNMHNAFDSVQLAKDLAEACSATARFFKRVPMSIRYLRKGNFAKAYLALTGGSTARQSIPTTYLQYQWAVRPLISELEELWEKLSPKSAPLFRISEASGKSNKRDGEIYFTWWGESQTIQYSQTVNLSVKAVRYFRHDILDTQGFHFSPFGAIWDGIPWSFLVDWFIPVSDVLKGMSYSIPGCVAGFNNRRYELRTEVTGVFPYDVLVLDRYRSRIEFPETSFRRFEFERVPDTSTSLNAAQVNELLWGSPAGLTLKRLLNLFNVAWVFASRK
jgi:hypothetical protein